MEFRKEGGYPFMCSSRRQNSLLTDHLHTKQAINPKAHMDNETTRDIFQFQFEILDIGIHIPPHEHKSKEHVD